jgi:hypothetical protein
VCKNHSAAAGEFVDWREHVAAAERGGELRWKRQIKLLYHQRLRQLCNKKKEKAWQATVQSMMMEELHHHRCSRSSRSQVMGGLFPSCFM